MPYFTKDQIATDMYGRKIFPGDILINIEEGCTELYHACYLSDRNGADIEIRDMGANNTWMCQLGKKGNVINLGNFTQNMHLLEDDDLGYYFGVDRELRPINYETKELLENEV